MLILCWFYVDFMLILCWFYVDVCWRMLMWHSEVRPTFSHLFLSGHHLNGRDLPIGSPQLGLSSQWIGTPNDFHGVNPMVSCCFFSTQPSTNQHIGVGHQDFPCSDIHSDIHSDIRSHEHRSARILELKASSGLGGRCQGRRLRCTWDSWDSAMEK